MVTDETVDVTYFPEVLSVIVTGGGHSSNSRTAVAYRAGSQRLNETSDLGVAL